MKIQDAIHFLQSHHVRTGQFMEWFEFSPAERTNAVEVLACIKSEFGSLPDINKAQIGPGNRNKSSLGFGLTRNQWTSILRAIPSVPQRIEEPSPIQTVSAYEAQMDFIHFYILHRFEIDNLYQQQRLESFFEAKPEFTHYKERVLRIKYLEQYQLVLFNERFLDIPPDHLNDGLKIGYYPLENHLYAPQDIMLAPDGKEARHYNKHKLVYGPVDFYRHGKKPITFNLITACAPNLMNSSPEDEKQFLNRDGRLNHANYSQACDELANFIVQATSKGGNTKLIMPAFGVGVYINRVPLDQKPEAVQLMYQAFARAAQQYKINVDWVVWSQEKNSYLQKSYLDQLKGENSFINNIPHDNMTDYAANLVENGIQCAVLNAGSDRTIGGKFTTENPKTVEEQLAQQSDLLFLQSFYNQQMVTHFNQMFYQAVDTRNQARQVQVPKELEVPKPINPIAPTEPQPITPPMSQLEIVDKILKSFETRIETVGFHKDEAKKITIKLAKDLNDLNQQCFNNPDQQPSLTFFTKKAEKLINTAIPELQKDLDWSDYLKNMLKRLINAVTFVCSFGQHQGFFALKVSNAAQNAIQLKDEMRAEFIPTGL